MITRRLFAESLLAAPAGRGSPNIVLVLCDDLGYGDPGCYNAESRMRTPHMDSLARDGVRFTDAHSPSAVCTPTRYGVLTGRYAWRTALKSGVLQGYSPSLIEPGRETVASFLRKRGYRTGGFGKWHLGLGNEAKTDYSKPLDPGPLDFGFDTYFGIPASLDMPPYLFFEDRRVLEQPTSTIETNGAPPRGAFWRGGPIAPSFRMEDVLPKTTERACRFIEESAPRGPFFAYVPFSAPHTPWVAIGARKGTSKAWMYGDFVEQVDDSLGQILAAIEKARVAENTLVIFTSDNGAPWSQPDIEASGGHRADGAWRGQKADIYEAGHRIPFLVRWPGRARPGHIANGMVCLTDFFATFAGILGAPLGAGMAEDSFSFAGALSGANQVAQRESLVMHSAQGLFAVRQGPWKLIEGRGSGGFTAPVRIEPKPGDPPGELYNLAEDPGERQNVWNARPDVVTRLTGLLAAIKSQGRSRPA